MNLRRLQYLEAMGVDVWLPRGRHVVAAASARRAGAEQVAAVLADSATGPLQASTLALHVAPGAGSCLFVCAAAAEAATPLASDLARTVGGAPVWAWPDGEATAHLEQVVEEGLFTAVIIFGETLARQLYGPQLPASCGPAPVLVGPALAAVAADATARRTCWAVIRAAGLHLGR